ncbi:uncharacterized protein LOC144435706 [Glandiceps talaboti]
MASKLRQVEENQPIEVLIKEGWCIKESGQKVFGRYNWKRRWFVLTQKGQHITLAYFENDKKSDNKLKGKIALTNKYITRYLDDGEKKKPFCFAVGPLVEDGTTRTYYISCGSEDDRLEWMEVLNSTIEGAPPSRTEERRRSVRLKAHKRQPSFTSASKIGMESDKYLNPIWRKQQWEDLVAMATKDNKEWKKVDCKDGVTIARMAFQQDKCATVKIDGFVDVPCDIVYDFLQRSLEPAGKLNYPFRNETVLQQLSGNPLETIVQCHYNVPLPHTSPRACCVLKTWLPSDMTSSIMKTNACGLMVYSVKHEQAKISREWHLCEVDLSGIVLRPSPSRVESNRTQLTCILQLNVQGTLQNVMKQAYKSKLLVLGLRSAYLHITTEIQQFMKLLDI